MILSADIAAAVAADAETVPELGLGAGAASSGSGSASASVAVGGSVEIKTCSWAAPEMQNSLSDVMTGL